MKMINCSKKTYKDHLAFVTGWNKDQSWDLKNEKAGLSKPGATIPSDIIKHTEYGRQVKPEMFLMALRADTRGKLALTSFLPKPRFGEEERNGRTVRVRLPFTPEEKAEALAKQHDLLMALVKKFPNFFTGMLVEDEPKKGAA